MLTDSPGRSLFFFALPMILGNLFQQFYSTVDSIIVGQYVGEDALAAVGASYSLTTVFIMIAIGGGIGASVVISQYLGAGLNRQMKTSVYTALLSFLGVSIVLGVVGLVFSRNILTALNRRQIFWRTHCFIWIFILQVFLFCLCTTFYPPYLTLWGIQKRRCIC